ncbi:TIGR03745 family integrating conjugative element membrane protein, partial [Salmonella enterica subsp. salamae]|nr:TIGR03745 family integrating conjugative element membrane protein [Salmonella enterica subsp. salamae]
MRWLLLLLTAFNAFADLPTMEAPSRGQGKGIMETLQNYGFDIVVL